MKKYSSLILLSVLVFACGNASAQKETLVNNTKGNLRNFINRILNADNKSVQNWASNDAELDFSGFKPKQIEHLKAFAGNVAIYKYSLAHSFALGSDFSRFNEFNMRYQNNMPFDEADDYYRTTMTDPGKRLVAGFSFGAPPTKTNGVEDDLWTTENYRNYLAAMLAKAGAANNIHAVMCLDGSYTKEQLTGVLQYGIRAAQYVYDITPTNYIDQQVATGRNEIIAGLKAKINSGNCQQIDAVKREEAVNVMDWVEDMLNGAGKTIKIKNLSEKPVLITRLIVSNCRNTSVAQCTDRNLRIVIPPNETFEIYTVNFPFKKNGTGAAYQEGAFQYRYWAEFAK